MKKASMKKSSSKEAKGIGSASEHIDARIEELGDWRGEMLARIREIIRQADPDVVEEWKWRGVPVWEHDGIICTGETYKAVVKLTFAKGALLENPSGLFNASLEGNVRRAIDIRQGDRIDEKAFKALIRAAVALNTAKRTSAARPRPARPRLSALPFSPGEKLQFQQCESLQDQRIPLSAMGAAQDRLGDELDVMGADGLGKRGDGRLKRLLHHRDHLGRK